ncbi:GIY-YIG nuclease family protein [Pedobacter cryotolerans]|uniref:GIY-YIG nuclease family protein n=1 Tax=Pedobacter cryotolerans TaxID=2571270 RepID=A0A4U1BX62_9SPHI|nr:GIY-YIG nuclease family protein [Pedobacter cryotolerans]TKB97125.1 GIY-YIG nuclease family protein [Pedobacter cryotolerans]
MNYHNYAIYILTNKARTVLYIGVTNDLSIRLQQHIEGYNAFSFTSKYNCFYLVHFEHFQYVDDAIAREKELKGWSREKKNSLIETDNKDWRFLNDEVIQK